MKFYGMCLLDSYYTKKIVYKKRVNMAQFHSLTWGAKKPKY